MTFASGIYLEDNPPRTQQFRCPRRERPSGVFGVHTAESVADEVGPDTGAENVAGFITRRTGYGSYHLLCDSDSIIQLVRYTCVAYHIGTYGLNEHTIGVSAAVQASRWNEVGDDWEDATLRNMARASAHAARWLKRNYGIVVPARKLTLTQARNKVPGFIAHGDADPERRTDPDGPNREFKWSRFLSYYAAEMAGGLEEDDMPAPKDWDAEDRKVIREALHGENHFTGRRIVIGTGKNEDWFRREDIATTSAIDEKLTALLAALDGVDETEIIARIEAHHSEVLARLEADAIRDEQLLELIQAVGSGERDAADVVDEIGRRLLGEPEE